MEWTAQAFNVFRRLRVKIDGVFFTIQSYGTVGNNLLELWIAIDQNFKQ